jgi:CRP/FNR family transcriptional regulator, cyclic AMP receptor protein
MKEAMGVVPVATMLARFEGEAGKARLAQCLGRQRVLQGNAAVAALLADSAEVLAVPTGEIVIRQEQADNDVFFVVSGRFRIIVNGREIGTRGADEHVGEMAAIDPTSVRTASVVATEPSVIAKVSEHAFLEAANSDPKIWRELCIALVRRLDERKKFLRKPNEQPVLFIGSSSEHLYVAQALRDSVSDDLARVVVWNDDGVFEPSSYIVLDLRTQLEAADFAVLVAGADDEVTSRGKMQLAPRDNVILELGLFLGGLPQSRTFLLTPSGADLKIPSDLLGFTELRYKVTGHKAADVSGAATKLQGAISKAGAK